MSMKHEYSEKKIPGIICNRYFRKFKNSIESLEIRLRKSYRK